jgi:hypothetical protein
MENSSASNIAILYGLIGTIFGIVLNKAFDLLSMNKQHRLNIKKEFFIRKITTYEKAVSYLVTVQSIIRHLAANFKDSLDSKKYFDEDVTTKTLQALEKTMSDIASKTQEAALSLGLYIDVDGTLLNPSEVEQFYGLLGEIGLITQSLKLIGSKFPNVQYKTGNVEFDKQVENQLQKLNIKIANMDLVAERISQNYLSVVALLRDKVRHYE